ncbi:MAG: MobF family relaxase [Cyanobacteria bacterium P01_D01_bin.56]
MVASVKSIHAGSSYVFYLTAGPEYYTDGPEHEDSKDLERQVGYWLGTGAKRLGLTKLPIVERDQRVITLFKGINPIDGNLLRRGATTVRIYQDRKTGKKKAHKPVAAFDIVLSGDKTFDIIAGVGSAKIRGKVLTAYKLACADITKFLSRQIGYTRTSSGGKNREQVDLFCAAFPHQVSRASEIKVHTHLLVFNVGLKKDGTGGTLNSNRLLNKDFIFKLGQRFRNSLACHMADQFQDFGLQLEPFKIKNGYGYRVKGIPQKLCDALSSRRNVIKAKLAKETDLNSRKIQAIVLKTRPKKPKQINLTNLRAIWKEIVKEHDFDLNTFLAKSQNRYNKTLSNQALINLQRLRDQEGRQDIVNQWPEKTLGNPGRSLEIEAARAVRRQILRSKPSFPLAVTKSVVRNTSTHAENTKEDEFHPAQIIRKLQQQGSYLKWFQRRSLDEKLERAVRKAQKHQKWFKRKLLFLYAIGRINRKTYLKFTDGRGLPKTLLGIEWEYWSGKLKLSQRIHLRLKHRHGIPKFGMPKKSRMAINFSRAINQISEVQRLQLLKELESNQQSQRRIKRSRQRSHRLSD